MKKNEIKIGGTYLAKVSDKVVQVRIDAENSRGGWDATNLATNKKVRIKSAQRLRGPAVDRKAHAKAVAAADQQNARLRDEREASPDGMTASERAMAQSAAPAAPTTPVPAESTPAPEALEAVAVYDRSDKKWDACIREGKTDHAVLEQRFESDDDAKAAGGKWIAKYAKANDAGRRKLLGWTARADAAPATEAAEKKPRAKRERAEKPDGPRRPSGLDAAAQVLKEAGQPMRCGDVVKTMLDRGLWQTEGKTPAATIYSAILREITTKGEQSRFRKTDRGLFTVANA